LDERGYAALRDGAPQHVLELTPVEPGGGGERQMDDVDVHLRWRPFFVRGDPAPPRQACGRVLIDESGQLAAREPRDLSDVPPRDGRGMKESEASDVVVRVEA